MKQLLVNQDSQPVAYINKNAILQLRTGNVMGVVLGHCVFNKAGRAVGKLFHGILRNENGERVAILTVKEERSLPPIPEPATSEPVWDLIRHITDHSCLQIKEKTNWSTHPLEEFLTLSPA